MSLASLIPMSLKTKDKKFDLNLITKELLVYLVTLLYLLMIVWQKSITLFTSLLMITAFPIYIYLNKQQKFKEEPPVIQKDQDLGQQSKPTIR